MGHGGGDGRTSDRMEGLARGCAPHELWSHDDWLGVLLTNLVNRA
jgi:hypothetical protein